MRTWRWMARAAIFAGGSFGFGGAGLQAAPPAPNPTVTALSPIDRTAISSYVDYYATLLQSAVQSDRMVRDRRALLAPLRRPQQPPSAVFSEHYASTLTTTLQPLLNRPTLALNVMITLAKARDLATQPALQAGLTNSNAAVRYWAAWGLARIWPEVEQIPPAFQQAIAAVETALGRETDPVVMRQLCATLLAANPQANPKLLAAAPLVIAALRKIAATYAKAPPDNAQVAADIVMQLHTWLDDGAVLTDAQKNAAMTALTELISFPAQYWNAGALDTASQPQVTRLIAAGLDAMNAVSPTADFSIRGLGAASTPTQVGGILLQINELTGSQGQKGRVQKLFPLVPIPPRIPGGA